MAGSAGAKPGGPEVFHHVKCASPHHEKGLLVDEGLL